VDRPRPANSVCARIVSPRLSVLLVIAAVLAASVLFGIVYQAIGTARDRGRFPPLGRLVDIGGRRVHFLDRGQGSPAVVFESGISASSLNWTHLHADVSQFTRACAYDRASLGWSDSLEAPRTAAQLIADLHAMLVASGIPGPYVLVAHSFGSLLVGLYAAKYPQEIAGVIMIDPLSPQDWLNPTEVQSKMLRHGAALARRGAWLARIGVVRFALSLLTGGARRVPKSIARLTSGRGESVISRLVGEVGKMPSEVWPIIQAQWCQPKSFHGLAGALESLPAISAEAARSELPASVPLTILSAKNSIPAQAAERESLVGRSVRGRHIIAEKSGHWIHLDEPALVIAEIRAMVEAARPTV